MKRVGIKNNSRRGVAAIEAAIVMTMLLILMFGTWEVGRLIQVNQLLVNAAREGARVASGGSVNGTPVTVAVVQQAVRDYMTSAGLPTAAISGAQISVINTSGNPWVNPSDAQPLDTFRVSLLIPPGAPFNSLSWNLLNRLTTVNQMQVTVDWLSVKDTLVVVNNQLPY